LIWNLYYFVFILNFFKIHLDSMNKTILREKFVNLKWDILYLDVEKRKSEDAESKKYKQRE